jgi:hypothetical protein
MEKNTFDATAVVLALPFMADSVNAFQPDTRSTSRALSRIGREAWRSRSKTVPAPSADGSSRHPLACISPSLKLESAWRLM